MFRIKIDLYQPQSDLSINKNHFFLNVKHIIIFMTKPQLQLAVTLVNNVLKLAAVQ